MNKNNNQNSYFSSVYKRSRFLLIIQKIGIYKTTKLRLRNPRYEDDLSNPEYYTINPATAGPIKSPKDNEALIIPEVKAAHLSI